VVNTELPDAVVTSMKVIDFLKDKVELVINLELFEFLGDKIDTDKIQVSTLAEFLNKQLELLIAIGGDGTILRTLHKCNIKIFGINAGVVGFLTEVQKQNAVQALERLLNEDFTLDSRARLKTILNGKVLEPATNEAVIHTAEIAKMRVYQIYVDEIQAQTIRADGIIIATPTGSTSYALSAGGPILDPKVDAFIIVPIAPFKLSARPLVVPSTSKISIRFLGGRCTSILVIDGQVEYELTEKDELIFTHAETSAQFIRFHPNFYRLIEEKLTFQ